MDERQREIMAWINQQQEDAKAKREWWSKAKLAVIPLVIVTASGIIGEIIYFWIVFVPQIEHLLTK